MAIDVEQAMVAKLLATAAVAALISNRVHPLRLPDTATLPALTYQEISAAVVSAHDETAAGALTHARYQFDAWATSYSAALGVAKTVFDALHGFAGVITSGANTFTIQSCLRIDRRKNNDPETGLYWVSQDFMIWY